MRLSLRTLCLVAVLGLVLPISAAASAAPEGATLLAGSPEDFSKSCQNNIDVAKTKLQQLKAGKAKGVAAVELFDDALLLLGNDANRGSLAKETSPVEAMRTAGEKCQVDAVALFTDISLDRGLYDALQKIDLKSLDPDTQYYVTKTLKDFRRSGVDRDEATRAKIKALNEEIVKIGQEFGRNIAQDVRTISVDPADLNGLPDDFKRSHPAGADGKIVLKTDNTDYIPFMTYSTSSPARERFWKTYRLRGYPKNIEVLSRLMQKRYELATLLGYPNWAALVTEDKMIGSEKNAADFIEKISAASEARMKRDYAELLAEWKKQHPEATRVEPWDSTYLSEQVRAEKYDFDSKAVRPYFEYNRVKQGLFDVTSKMYGITYRRATDAKVWHPDVEAYDVVEKGKVLGRIYLDMFPRENKYKHYATFGLTDGKNHQGMPEAALVCNFPRPGKEPALMQHGDVVTFFHEFGHLIASIFSNNQQRWAGGPGVQWDFVEAPSQMLEEWTWDPNVLQTFAKHYQTGEPIPTELVVKMKKADDFGRGLNVRQQMFYAAVSLNYYNRDPKDVDTTKLAAELQSRYTPFPYVEGTYMQTAFGHLDGYSAIYYTYMWSLVIAKDMFTQFQQHGLLDPETAASYRHNVLERMNARPSAELVTKFLDRPYNFKAYESWLNGVGN